MAKKDSSAINNYMAQKIFDSYVAQEREKIENRGYCTTNAYDDFAKAARIINPNITPEELDKLYFENYNSQKYRRTALHWWEDSGKAESVTSLIAKILATAPTDKFMSRTDILEAAGAKKQKPYYAEAYWDAETLHAFELLENADMFDTMNIMTCGKVFIHLYRAK